MSTSVLTVFGLSKSYNIYPIFEDVTFTINAGERAALVGPNGVGKSTLLKVIAGLEKPTTGPVRALQEQLHDLEHRMSDASGSDWDALMSEYEKVTHSFEMAGGYTLEHR